MLKQNLVCIFCRYRDDGVLQRTCIEGAGTLLPTGLHWSGAERNQQPWLRSRGKHQFARPPWPITQYMMLNDARAVLRVQDRTVMVTSVFDKMTYWNLETLPNPDDRIVMAMDWTELAEAVSLCSKTLHYRRPNAY